MPITTTKNTQTGEFHYEANGTQLFTMPAISEVEAQKLPNLLFTGAIENLSKVMDQMTEVSNDATLSTFGRDQKLEPLQKSALLNIANTDAQLDREEEHFAKRESELLAVPKIDPSHSVAAIEAREIRDWLRSLPPKEKTEVLQKMHDEPGHDNLILALLRSPIPQLDQEAKFARDIWSRSRRLANPTEAFAIDQGRANIELSRKGTAHAAALTKRIVGWDGPRIARTLLTSSDPSHHAATKAFGIAQGQVEQAKRSIAHESRTRY